jgi:FAD/FMN-containing dehydrogenase
MTIVTPDGKIRHLSPTLEPELFKAIIGGYGMFGVILEIELKTLPNSNLKFYSEFMKPKEFAEKFARYITTNPNVELAYGRLSVDQSKLFEEAGLFWYEKMEDSFPTQALQPEALIALKRGVFRTSQYLNLGKKMRWSAEKLYAQKMSRAPALSRNNAMNTDIHILWPLYGENKDILHEYFVPKDNLPLFIKALKENIIRYDVNILNVTIREVRRDDISSLPYAKKDVFGLVCLFSQKQDAKAEKVMEEFTHATIKEVIRLEGTFYLPYRLHYTKEQLLTAYPDIISWVKLKEKWDPTETFNSNFFQYIKSKLS